MAHEWFTLEQAATHLGVSSRTLRRWIHAGKLHAELRPGPYGQQYLVPAEQLGAVEVIRDAAHVERQHEMEAVPQVGDRHLQDREQSLVTVMETLRAEVRSATERIAAGQDTLLEELRAIRRILEEGHSHQDDACDV